MRLVIADAPPSFTITGFPKRSISSLTTWISGAFFLGDMGFINGADGDGGGSGRVPISALTGSVERYSPKSSRSSFRVVSISVRSCRGSWLVSGMPGYAMGCQTKRVGTPHQEWLRSNARTPERSSLLDE